ncbi:MAG: histidine phosphatase family protein [Gemmatimonadota bacterium]|nr:histidine phosphatase family protein [Gemmatimonadota bacterium]
MQTLILVKHSLPEIDPSVPANEWVLSCEGRRRARILGVRLDRYNPDRIFSSTEPKATETAKIAAGNLNVPVEVDEGLHEHERVNVGFLEKQRFEQSIRQFYEQPDDPVFGEETADNAHDRFSRAVHKLTDRYPKENVAVVTHGTVLSLFVSRIADLEPFALWKKLGLPSWIVLSRPGIDIVEICPGIGDEESIGGA